MYREFTAASLKAAGTDIETFEATLERTLEFMRQVGTDPNRFEQRSAQTIGDLTMDQIVRELTLLMPGSSGKPGKLGYSSRLIVSTPKEILVESYRIVRGKIVRRETSLIAGLPIPPSHAFSESGTRLEAPRTTINRCLIQEGGVDITCPKESSADAILRQIIPEDVFDTLCPEDIKLVNAYPHEDRHDSSVYDGFEAITLTTWYELHLPGRIGPDTIMVPDGTHKVNCLEWQPLF